MQRTLVLFGLFVALVSQAQAIEPLQADMNPALYTPFVTYRDAGSNQDFYYDNQQNTFFVITQAAGSIPTYTDQVACQIKANFLAATNILSHGSYVIGLFEGIGFGFSPNCDTCVPSYGMTLTGDAVAQSANGSFFRVRSWR